MRTQLPMALGLAALLVAATACSSGSPQPAQVSNYGPATGAASSTTGGTAYNQPAAPAPVRSAPSSGPIRWHTRLADAQAEARASGKLILVTSTKPRCSLCKKFQYEVAPATGGELTRMAVGYVYDITRPEVRDVDRLLRANLRGADLMPLVGFITPEMGWVHGFWGQRSVQQFRGDIARAMSIHPVRTASVAAPIRTVEAPRMGMVVNEYGEPEWGNPTDIWPEGDPEPIDAITGDPEPLPDDAAPGPTGPIAGPNAPGTMLADATSTPTAEPAPLPEAPVPAGPSGLPPIGPAASAPAPVEKAPVVAETPAPKPEPLDDESWGRKELQRALMLISAGDFDTARSTLAGVKQRLPDTKLAREAGKGGIALYNAKRIRFATSGAERNRYLDRARRDFSNSMWAPLFNS